jgi:hypothetical protein
MRVTSRDVFLVAVYIIVENLSLQSTRIRLRLSEYASSIFNVFLHIFRRRARVDNLEFFVPPCDFPFFTVAAAFMAFAAAF